MSSSLYNFPDQTVSEGEKTEQWHINHALGRISGRTRSNYTDRKTVQEKLYRAYLCIMDKEEKKLHMTPVVAPEGITIGLEYQIYNLIEQKIEQLVGDWMERPVRKKAYVLNKDAQVAKLDALIDMQAEQIIRELNKKIKDDHGIDIESPNPEMEVHDDVEEFFSKNYRSASEEVADDLAEKFLTVDKNKQILPEVLKDLFIGDECHLDIVFEDGILKWRKGHPLNIDCDVDSNKVVQNDHELYSQTVFYSENEIYNRFELTKKEKEIIRADFSLQGQSSSGTLTSGNSDNAKDSNGWFLEDAGSFRMAIFEMSWKSRKTIRAKSYKNQSTGETSYQIMNEKDRPRKEDNVKTTSVEMPRHVVMAGPNVCLSWGLEENRNYRIVDRKKCYLDPVSLYRQNTIGGSAVRSVAAKLYKMQLWASEILFELRLAMRKNNGKVMIYDTAQTPRQYLKNNRQNTSPLNQVMHHMKKDQMVFINTKDKNNKFGFNQFTSIDLSNSNQIRDLMEGLMLIEDLADRMIGLTDARKGTSGQHTTSTNVESQRAASFSRSEIFYRPFDDFLQVAMERMLMKAKQVYKEGETIHYVLGDLRAKFIQIMPEFMNDDMGLYFNDAGKDAKKKQIIDSVAENTIGNAQTPEMMGALIDILCEDTAVEARAILDKTIKTLSEVQQASSRAEQEAVQAKQQADEDKTNEEHKLTREGHRKDERVAHIYADQKNGQVAKQENTKKMLKLADIENQKLETLKQ